jgi:hypothetical protein
MALRAKCTRQRCQLALDDRRAERSKRHLRSADIRKSNVDPLDVFYEPSESIGRGAFNDC